MLRVLSLSILLTAVYSWEDLKRTIRIIAYGLAGRKHPGYYYLSRLDRMVGTLVLTATIPIALTYYLVSPGTVGVKLFWLAFQLVLFTVLAAGAGTFVRWVRASKHFHGKEKTIPLTLSVAGLVAPVFALFGGGSAVEHRPLLKFAFLMSLPPLAGLLLYKLVHYHPTYTSLLPNIDNLIALLVVALFMRITIEVLERYFKLYRLERVFSYFRILLGIALITTIALGLGR